MQAHPYADHVTAVLGQQGRGHRRIDPARHGDQHALAHAEATSLSGSATARAGRRRRRAMVEAMMAAASSISRGRGRSAQAQAQRAAGLVLGIAQRGQHVRRLERAGRARRPSRCRDALDVQRAHQLAAVEVADDDRQQAGQPAARVAGQLDARNGQHHVAQPVAQAGDLGGGLARARPSASSYATAMPTAPATFSVPARR